MILLEAKLFVIEGNVNTNGDIIVNKFIGNTNVGKVIDNFKPIEHRNELKEDMTIYHNKYGKGVIESVYTYHTTGGSMRVNFDNEDIVKTLMLDKVLINKSISRYNNDEINKLYEEEFIE